MSESPRTRLFAVVGRPVLHSRSPDIQQAALRAAGLDGAYFRLAAPSAGSALRTAREMGLAGLNVTAPFKEEMARAVDALDEAAAALGAVNAVVVSAQGRATGHNTDVEGVSGALRAAGVEVGGKCALVLGAGGAAKAATLALLGSGARVVVANRTVERARAWATALARSDFPSPAGPLASRPAGAVASLRGGSAHDSREVRCVPSPERERSEATGRAREGKRTLESAPVAIGLEPRSLLALAPTVDLVVGCADTAEPLLPPGFLRGHMAVLEAGYARETALMREARAAGCRIVDGRDWLLYQGASAFALFTGAAADLPAMRAALDEAPKPGRPGIALIGFMGSGKSRVAAELARRTGAPVEELDARVERRAGAKITEIFARQGEAAFRAMESAELRAALERPGAVLSCGGGAVLDPRNVEALRARCTVVWLWADVPHVLARISDARERPLLAGPDREARARELLTARLPSYAAAADLAIDTAGLTPDSIAEVILDETHRARPR